MVNNDDYDNSEAKYKLMREFGDWDSSVDFDDLQPECEEILEGKVKSPSALEGGGFRFGVYQLVGHGRQTNHWCGTFGKFIACSTPHLHNKMVFDAASGSIMNYSGKTDVRPVFRSCDKPTCPVCYERGWATREAGNIEFRLEESVKRFKGLDLGEIEHIIVAPDTKFWGYNECDLRKMAVKALTLRGVVGGALIFHGARFDHDVRRWYWSPHYHCLGFIRGGFRRCRGCRYVNDKGSRFFCGGCEGFYGVSKKLYETDGFIVEVKDKRKNVYGTAWYQLHHATVRTDKKRANVVRWFGVCSYRRIKIPKEARRDYDEKRKPVCRICGSRMVRHEYCGHDRNVIAFLGKRRGAREKIERFFGVASDFVPRPEKWDDG